MSDWKVISPVATTNEITNPSLETGTTGWTNSGMATFERSSTYAKYGNYSLHCIADATADSAVGNTVANADAGETWAASCWVYIVAGDFALVIQEDDGAWSSKTVGI